MRFNWAVFCRVLFVTLLALFPVFRCDLNVQELEKRITALSRLANFLMWRSRQINIDGLFGVTLAEAHLAAALSHPNAEFLEPENHAFINAIFESLHWARMHMKGHVHPENPAVATISTILNEPDRWKRPIFWQANALGPRPEPTAGINPESVMESLFHGTPQEKESDYCIGQLAAEVVADKACEISNECTQMLMRQDKSAGYPLIHRLLYVQTARTLNCSEPSHLNLAELIPLYCKYILQNLVDAEAVGFPSMSRDLAIEQVFLCGMEGFLDFANTHYATLIRSWAHPAGCYNSSQPLDENKNSPKVASRWKKHRLHNSRRRFRPARRSSQIMDYGCESHSSGIATGVLALLVREGVENTSELPFSPDDINNEGD